MTSDDTAIRDQLLKLAHDLPHLAGTRSKLDGVLVKDQLAGLVVPKKSLKTNISVDLAISLATGGRFLGYFRVAEPKRPAMFSGESGMAT